MADVITMPETAAKKVAATAMVDGNEAVARIAYKLSEVVTSSGRASSCSSSACAVTS